MKKLPIPPGDELSYNGFVFDANTSTELTITPIMDRAKRTHTHYVHEVTARMRVAEGNGAVAALARSLLTQPAGVLVYRGRGAGTHRIGGVRGNPDLMWGPTPGPVKFRPLGGPSAVELVWSVKWATMTCSDAVFVGQPMEFNYSVDFDIDYAGLTTRRYSAFLRIPQSRRTAADRIVQATADAWRESATPTIPAGFRRTVPANAKISEDKCELTLTCVDEEFPGNIYPPGVVKAEASYSFDSVPGSQSLSWIGRLSGTYEIAKGGSVADGLNAYFATLKDKIDGIQKAVQADPRVLIPGAAGAIAIGAAPGGGRPAAKPGIVKIAGALYWASLLGGLGGFAGAVGGRLLGAPAKPVAENTAPCIIPWSFSFREPEIYGRPKVEVTTTFRVVGLPKEVILSSGGLWRAVPGSNWRRWITSVPIHQGPRGYAQLTLDYGSDVIHDLCRPVEIIPPPDGAPTDVDLRGGGGFAPELRGGGAGPKRPKKKKPIDIVAAAHGIYSGVYKAGSDENQRFFQLIGSPAEDIAIGALRAGRLHVRTTPISELFPKPTPESSWLEYSSAARIENDSGVVIGKTLPSEPLTADSLASRSGSTGSLSSRSSSSGSLSARIASLGTTFAHQRTTPTTYIVISGFGIRAGFPIPRPDLLEVNGAKPVACSRPESGDGFEQLVAGNCGVPIYYARWQQRYALTGALPKGNVPVPDNNVVT